MIRQPRTTKTNETNSSEKNGGARRTRVRSAPSSFFSFFFFRSSPFNVSRCTPFSSDICCSRPRDEPLSKNVRHCRRQLSPSGNSPPPPTSCFSFFFFLFCFFFFASRPTFVFHQPARRRSPASHRIFHEFQMRQCTLQGQKGPVGVWVAAVWIIADYSRNLANLVLTARELARIRFFFLFLAFFLSLCFPLRVLWVAELRAGC